MFTWLRDWLRSFSETHVSAIGSVRATTAPTLCFSVPAPLCFRKADYHELDKALRDNGKNGSPIFMNSRDTSFLPGMHSEEDEVIMAIRSVPTHY